MDIKDNWPALAIAALLGTSGGGGVSTYLQGQHTHPEIMDEIRGAQYEGQIFRLNVQIAAMEESGQQDTADYLVAVSMLTKFSTMLADLK